MPIPIPVCWKIYVQNSVAKGYKANAQCVALRCVVLHACVRVCVCEWQIRVFYACSLHAGKGSETGFDLLALETTDRDGSAEDGRLNGDLELDSAGLSARCRRQLVQMLLAQFLEQRVLLNHGPVAANAHPTGGCWCQALGGGAQRPQGVDSRGEKAGGAVRDELGNLTHKLDVIVRGGLVKGVLCLQQRGGGGEVFGPVHLHCRNSARVEGVGLVHLGG